MGIKLPRLRHAVLGEGAHRLWHLGIVSEFLEASGGLAIWTARFLGGDFGSCLASFAVRLRDANFASGLAACAARLSAAALRVEDLVMVRPLDVTKGFQ